MIVAGAVLIYDSLLLYVLKVTQGSQGYFGVDFKELLIGVLLVAVGCYWLSRLLLNSDQRSTFQVGLVFLGLAAPMLAGMEIHKPLWFTSHEEVEVISGSNRGDKLTVRNRYVKKLDEAEQTTSENHSLPASEPASLSRLPAGTLEKSPPVFAQDEFTESNTGRDSMRLDEITHGNYELVEACGDGKSIDPDSMALVEEATGTNEAMSYAGNAEALLREAIAKDARNLIAYDRLGLLYLIGMGDPEAAIGVYKQALEALPGCASIHFDLGNAFSAAKNYVAAQRELNSAIVLTPEPPASYFFNLGNAHLNAGDAEGSIANYLEALERDSSHSKARNNLTRAYIVVRNIDALMMLYRDDAVSLRRIGVTLGRESDSKNAVRVFERALHLEEDADTYYNLALNYGRLHRKAEARTAAERALALQPDHDGALAVIRLLDP
jgi:Tfp pilus assembly protein PilF